MNLLNRKGAALMQVLLITIILAGMATMLLRVSLSRTASARKTRRASSANILIQACMAEVNTFWSSLTEEAFIKHMNKGKPYFSCSALDANGWCPDANRVTSHVCQASTPYGAGTAQYQVTAKFNNDGKLVYEVNEAGSANL